MSGRGIAAFAAGFGTGYLNTKKQQKEDERQAKKDQIEQERFDLEKAKMEADNARQAKADAQEQAVTDGLDKANAIQVGHGLYDKNNQEVNVGEDDIKARLDANKESGLSEETKAAVAKTYADAVKPQDVEGWTGGMSGEGKLRTARQSDIVRQQGIALQQGNNQERAQGMQLQEKADALDIKDLRNKIVNAQSIEELSKHYDDIFPDGLTLAADVGTDGKFYKHTVDANGNKGNWQVFDNFDQYKQSLDAMVSKDPETIQKYWQESRAIERQNKLDAERQKETEYKHGRDSVDDKQWQQTFDQKERHQNQTTQLEREKIAAKDGEGLGGNSVAGLKYIQDTTDKVTQKVAQKLESDGKFKPQSGTGKFGQYTEDGEGNRVQTGVKYVVDPKLAQHAQKLVAAGVPEADAVQLLADRKTIKGKQQYTNYGTATVLENGEKVQKAGIIYKGKLIPLD